MDIHAIDSKQLSQLAQLKTDELAGKCFVSSDEVGKDARIGGRSVRLAQKTETDSAANLAMRNQILKSLGENYDIRGFEDEVRGLLGVPKEGGETNPASGEKLVDAARVRDVVRYVQAKTADVNAILDKVLVKAKFSDQVKAVLGKTLVNEASNDIVFRIINAEPPTLDDLTRLCKLAAQTHPQDTFEDKLAVAYLKGFSATIKGDVPIAGNLASKMELLKAEEEKGAADHQQEVIAQTEDHQDSKVAEDVNNDEDNTRKDESELQKFLNESNVKDTAGAGENTIENEKPDLETKPVEPQTTEAEKDLDQPKPEEKEVAPKLSVDDKAVEKGPAKKESRGFFAFFGSLFSKTKPAESKVVDSKNPLEVRKSSKFSELETSLKEKLGDKATSGILDMIDGHVAKQDPSVKDSFKEAVASLMLNKMSGRSNSRDIQNFLFRTLKDFENGIKKSTPAEAKFYLLCVKFNLKLKNEIVGKLKSDIERAIADDFMLKMQGSVDGTDTSLYSESVHNGQIDDNALESRWEEAIKASHLKDAKLNQQDLEGFFAKESKFDLATANLPVEDAGKTVIRQQTGSNMCYIKSPINGLLAAGQLEKVKSVLTPDKDGSYTFNLGEEFVKENQDKAKTVFNEIKVTKEEIADIRNAGGEEFSDVELALYLAHNKTTDDPVELKMFGEADRVINCFGYQRSSDLRKESKISINREPLINAGRNEKKAKYLQDGLGDALAKVYDAGQWLDQHKDGVMLLNINEIHFVAVTGVYYKNNRDFGFVVRDSASNEVAHTVNVRESGDMFMVDVYVPNKASEYKPLT